MEVAVRGGSPTQANVDEGATVPALEPGRGWLRGCRVGDKLAREGEGQEDAARHRLKFIQACGCGGA